MGSFVSENREQEFFFSFYVNFIMSNNLREIISLRDGKFVYYVYYAL